MPPPEVHVQDRAGTTVELLVARSLCELGRVRHGFTTRRGGVSRGPFESLNLALRPGEDPLAVVENWERAAGALLPGARAADLALADQVHGAAVLRVSRPSGPLHTLGAADALVTTRPGTILAVRGGDCLPVLLAAPGGVAAAHAGWRGVALGVVPAALQALLVASGASPGEVRVAIGPHATGARFETGPDVPAALLRAGVPAAAFLTGERGGKALVDLAGAVEAQLRAAGVRHVERVAGCTLDEPARFFSHRREGQRTGRQAGLIALA